MKKNSLIILCILSCASLAAQKTVHKVIADNAVTVIEINASQAYELVVKTAASPRIDIQAVMDGEYGQDIMINTHKESGHFIIGTSFNPSFRDPNDKLSAHKVISVLLIVELPENSDLIVSGGNTHITV
ncbi:MAG: hypothetical protein KDD04_11255, partial [Sinomicrobium sp.]|nr:hypothetical protein [Sinomicrobium sp.]